MPVESPPMLRKLGIRLMEVVRRTDALDLLPELLASQWWSTDQLRDLQRQRLRELLGFCADEVPYYTELFDRLDFDPRRGDPLETLSRLPVLDKHDIREAGTALRSRSFPRLQPRPKATSGSTGTPLSYHLDRLSHGYLWAQIWRAWNQAGYRPGDRFATLSGGSLVPDKVNLKERVYLALNAAIYLPCYHMTESIMERYRGTLRRRRVRYLYGYPTAIGMFADFCLAKPATMPPLAAVFTTSEVLAPRARTAIESAFGCPVYDTYGLNDGGLYSFECAEHAGFHYSMEGVVVEVVDEAGKPLPEGEIGSIVTTHLMNRANPFLRYVTGDVGALNSEPCSCGRGLVRIVNLQGRERDIVWTPAGRKVHGAFFNHFTPFYRAEWLERYQIYQPHRDSLIVRLQVKRDPTEAEKEEVIAELRKCLGDMRITLDIGAEMTYTRTGKFRVVISDVS